MDKDLLLKDSTTHEQQSMYRGLQLADGRHNMSVINDMAEKAAHWRPEPPLAIYAEDHAEKLTCSMCGRQYVSRGKFDPGICRECEAKKKAHLIGGPLDGEPAYDEG